MNRWLLIGSLAALLMGSTGCSLHNKARKDCSSCGCPAGASCGHINNAYCGTGCNECGGSGCEAGKMERLAGLFGLKDSAACPTGCQPGRLGWQQGGLDYSSYLHPGPMGQTAGHQLQNRPYQPGPPTSQVAYPYYTHRGPRDFLMSNPPTIGR
jgi:hypothetical protein